MNLRGARRADFAHLHAIATRWMDNDVYGHVNNVHYYSYFDTAVNAFLVERGVLDFHQGDIVGYVVETGCSYFRSIAFPDVVHVGIRVARLGGSSVRYEVGIFRNDEDDVAAGGFFVHVYVDRRTGKSTPIPDPVRDVLSSIRMTSDPSDGQGA
ncbi:acyl-CoA thioesterase [Pararobbsia silviterrae]|uniref:Acyl-CoA thioesterase n=1 Tax=Pararobbsia silviterrae TaxID=1792498 RepID=A0A494XZ79_9BURK|nr:thioesterase family protein [Pararobbsia silviterrae]RKP55864.1 acyl-CoA thioesterase [Pararobbsia silviterrae]